LLTSCDPHIAEGPIAARSSGTDVEFIICTSVTVGEIYVDERNAGVAQSGDEVWISSGSGVFDIGAVVRLGQDPPGLSTDLFDQQVITDESTLAIVITPTGVDRPVLNGEFSYSQLLGAPGAWFDSSGNETDQPCRGYS
jgi:hypothetical protein